MNVINVIKIIIIIKYGEIFVTEKTGKDTFSGNIGQSQCICMIMTMLRMSHYFLHVMKENESHWIADPNQCHIHNP